MNWHQTVTAASTNTIYENQNLTTATGNTDNYVMEWIGRQRSWADGYEYTGGADQWVRYSVDTAAWSNSITWEKYWIRVDAAHQQQHRFLFYWVGEEDHEPFQYGDIHEFTVNFAPIPEAREVSPENFMKFLERIGHDDDFLRLQLGKQKQHWEAIGEKPPWDPEKVAELEQKRIEFRAWIVDHIEEARHVKERLMERWGIEEIPPITPELLDQIELNSRKFLEECLSPEEMKFFDEHGHCKIRSLNEPEIHYIVKVDEYQRVERYKKDELVERICIHSGWGNIPALDTVAMKVLNIKYNEEGFLRTGNRTPAR